MTTIDNLIKGVYTPEQFRAIRGGIELGRTLQRDHPHIDYLWWQGGSYLKVVEMLDIQVEYGVTYDVAMGAVHRAIAGHGGGFKIPAYDGLIPEEERKEIAMKNNVESGHKLCEERKGVHGRTLEERREGGRKGAIAKGLILWTNEEIEFAYQLYQQPEYQWEKPNIRGKPNNELIALELNIQYHNCNEVRTKKAVNGRLHKYRKSLADKLE